MCLLGCQEKKIQLKKLPNSCVLAELEMSSGRFFLSRMTTSFFLFLFPSYSLDFSRESLVCPPPPPAITNAAAAAAAGRWLANCVYSPVSLPRFHLSQNTNKWKARKEGKRKGRKKCSSQNFFFNQTGDGAAGFKVFCVCASSFFLIRRKYCSLLFSSKCCLSCREI